MRPTEPTTVPLGADGRPARRWLVRCLFAAALFVAAVPLAAQPPAEAPAPPADVFGEVVDVRVVNVEVVVTDRSGARVLGLGPESFRLEVDGEAVPITYFSEVVGGVAKPSAEVDAEDGTALPAAAPTVEGVVGNSYLVFVDESFVIARDRNRVLRELADGLDLLGPGDRMAIVAFDGRRVELLSSWSESRDELRRAIVAATDRPAQGFQVMADVRSHERTRDMRFPITSRGIMTEMAPEDRFFAQEMARRVERAVAGATAALRGFAQPPGRKIMLLMAGEWPFSPAAFAANSREVAFDGSVARGPELLRPLVDTANLLGYTLYPIDVPGFGAVGGVDAETTMAADGSLPDVSFDREWEGEESLHHLARATGGRALINAQRLDPLENVKADTASYYWLGFTAPRAESDRQHRISVELTRPGLAARSRTSYLDLSREAERGMEVESLLLFGDSEQQEGLLVEVGEGERSGRRQVRVPLHIAIPVDFVTLVPDAGQERWMARLELRVGALDERRRESDIPAVPLTLTFSEAPEAGKFIPYSTELVLRRAEQVLVVTVTDAVSGRSLGARKTIDP